MANENHEDWSLTPGLINETVRAAKVFIEGELGKYGTWEEFRSSHLMKILDGSRKEDFSRIKKTGPGQTTILKFLGNNWKQWQIQEALKVIKADEFAANQKAKAEEMRRNAEKERKRLEAEQAKKEGVVV